MAPQDARAVLGRKNLTKRLGKVTQAEANRLAVPVVADFQSLIAEARARKPVTAEPSPLARFSDPVLGEIRAFKKGEGPQRTPYQRIMKESAVAQSVVEQMKATGDRARIKRADVPQAPWQNGAPLAPKARVISLDDVFEGYAGESGLAPATRKRWLPVVNNLKRHLDHNDAAVVTPENIIDWKETLLRDRAAGTVRNVYLAAVKAMFNWAVENRKVSTNPASGITVRVQKKAREREKGFTLFEAQLILREALLGNHSNVSAHYQRARRWIPWLCAYSGARVGEIARLRGCDVSVMPGYHVIRITPEAGSVKTGEARLVPLHPHLIEQGFLATVAKVGNGALFYDPLRARTGNAVNPQYKKAGEHIAK